MFPRLNSVELSDSPAVLRLNFCHCVDCILEFLSLGTAAVRSLIRLLVCCRYLAVSLARVYPLGDNTTFPKMTTKNISRQSQCDSRRYSLPQLRIIDWGLQYLDPINILDPLNLACLYRSENFFIYSLKSKRTKKKSKRTNW